MNFLNELWSGYLVHLVDIMIVTYIFYKIILMVRGTRAVQIITGITILLLITFFSGDVFHFTVLSWILERFWLAAVVIIAVVFQPEIRSALVELGSQKWASIFKYSEPSFINEVVEATEEFSEKKIGALMVIEQQIGLKDFIQTGTLINANVSDALLVSLFNKESPLHDGAVIMAEGRIIAAGCILPLSNEGKIKISKNFGTRHCAGLGLSEMTDALVIVVSEESGRISMSFKGQMQSDMTPEELRRKLIDLYWKRPGGSTFLRTKGKNEEGKI